MTHPPRIGFSLDYETGGGYSRLPWYAIRENYMDSVSSLGATALALAHDIANVEDYLNLLDGVVITGGAFDIPPALYGDDAQHLTVSTKEERTAFEYALVKGALERNIPILGICGGQQLLGVLLGCSLHQHIPDAVQDALEHEQKNPRTQAGHNVTIKENTLLYRIVGQSSIAVNSAHHQAISHVPGGVIINAVAPDGVIEGIEYPAHRFCLGVQWHPEYHISPADTRIFAAFVAACSQ